MARSVAVETQSTVATVITNKQIDDLPTIARNFSALATLAPGATTSNATGTGQGTGVSISGQRPFTNGIVVDGASNLMQFYGRQSNDFPRTGSRSSRSRPRSRRSTARRPAACST